MIAQTPAALWNCISEVTSLAALDLWFEDSYGTRLLGSDGKLLFPLCRRLGFRFSRTPVNGLSVCKHGRGEYSVYESRELYEMRRFNEEWTAFLEGTWSDSTPVEPGMYFARDREGRQSVRQIVQLPGGGLHDATGGYVTKGQVSHWRGDWWLPRIPLLKGAK